MSIPSPFLSDIPLKCINEFLTNIELNYLSFEVDKNPLNASSLQEHATEN